jgi:hypothetical protein
VSSTPTSAAYNTVKLASFSRAGRRHAVRANRFLKTVGSLDSWIFTPKQRIIM